MFDGIVDVVVGEIAECPVEGDWNVAIRQRVLAARTVLLRHRWAARLIESRTHTSPVVVRYMESVIRMTVTADKVRTSGELSFGIVAILCKPGRLQPTREAEH